jgi:hypothetical protein
VESILEGFKYHLAQILLYVRDASGGAPLLAGDFNASGLDQEDLNALFDNYSN